MKSTLCLSALFLACSAPFAWSQHVLVVTDGGKPEIVVGAHGLLPMVLENGKPRVFRANRFALVKAGEYLPLFVAVRHAQAGTSALRFNTGDEVNKDFHFSCELETAYPLADVFLVILLKNDRADKGVFLYEVGEMEPRHTVPISLEIPTVMDNAPGQYELYLFSGGRELFQSMMPFGLVESALNKIVREHLKGVQNASPQPFLGPMPEYPDALAKKKMAGSATVSFAIGVDGAVSDPALVSASRPEFGAAAMEVIRQWRFLPKVKDGHPVATRAQLPFEFPAP